MALYVTVPPFGVGQMMMFLKVHRNAGVSRGVEKNQPATIEW